MAATLVQTFGRSRDVRRVKYAVTAHTDGTASVTFAQLAGFTLERVEVVPNTSTDQPTDLFDLALTNETGVDLLEGGGADRSNSVPSVVEPNYRPALVFETLTLALTNMGSGKKCDVYLYARPAV